jgi:hypothetical protein
MVRPATHLRSVATIAFVLLTALGFTVPMAGFAHSVPASPDGSLVYLPVAMVNAAPGISILKNQHSYVTTWGSLHVLGEVQNSLSFPVQGTKIKVKLLDKRDKIIAEASTYTYMDTLPDGHRTCFDVIFLEPPGTWSTYSIELESFTAASSPLPNIVITSAVGGAYTPGEYSLEGRLRNDTGRRVECIKPVGTLYTAKGRVTGCGFTYITSTNLDNGQSSSFNLIYYGHDYSDVVSYHLQADGNVK